MPLLQFVPNMCLICPKRGVQEQAGQLSQASARLAALFILRQAYPEPTSAAHPFVTVFTQVCCAGALCHQCDCVLVLGGQPILQIYSCRSLARHRAQPQNALLPGSCCQSLPSR